MFINACEMGFVEPLSFTTFIRFFVDRGARTIVAPDCKVSDRHSARFSNLFYKYFTRGDSIMVAMFNARHEMYRKHQSLIGFAYSLYGQPDAYLTTGRCLT